VKLRTVVAGFLTMILGVGLVGASLFLSGARAQASTPTKVITLTHGGGLDNNPPPSCDGGQLQALFIINQISDAAANAPASITAFFSNGSSGVYPLFQVEKSNAHYLGDVPAGAEVVGAQALIYDSWSGSFVLSHYTCGTSTTTTTEATTTTTQATTTTTQATTTTTEGTTTTTQGGTTTTTQGGTTSTTEGGTTSTTQGGTTSTTEGGTSSTTAKLGSGSGTTSSTDGNTTTTALATGTTTAAATAASGQLAFTGTRSGDLAWLGLALICVGLLLTAGRRRGGSRASGQGD
jgi:hypothetical protein